MWAKRRGEHVTQRPRREPSVQGQVDCVPSMFSASSLAGLGEEGPVPAGDRGGWGGPGPPLWASM